jgi:hypothetical protein
MCCRHVCRVKGKLFLPILLLVVFALTRLPGLMPDNFSAAYAIAFCAGVFFPKRIAWWIPLVTLLITDLGLNCYYQFYLGYPCFTVPVMIYMLGNYAGYALLIWLGKRFTAKSSIVLLLSGGVLGAILFYFITNTLSWLLNPFHNPEYTKNFAGWLWAMTKGTGGWPETWTFFRNTLLSGGLFTGLFVGAVKMNEASAKEEEKEEAPAPAAEPSETPEEAGA